MPEYTYKCPSCRCQFDTRHRMAHTGPVLCPSCNHQAAKVPQLVGISWGGLPPSSAGHNPAVAQHIANAERSRAEFEVKNYERDRNIHS